MSATGDFCTVQPKNAPPEMEGIMRLLAANEADMKESPQQALSAAAAITVADTPRKSIHGRPISASDVRRLLVQQGFSKIKELVPSTTLQLLESKSP